MTRVSGQVVYPNTATPVAGAHVEIRAIGSTTDPSAPAFVPAASAEIFSPYKTSADDYGHWHADLIPSDELIPVGCLYSVLYRWDGDTHVFYIDVPASPSEVWVADISVPAGDAFSGLRLDDLIDVEITDPAVGEVLGIIDVIDGVEVWGNVAQTGGGSGGSALTVQLNDVTVDAAVTTLDFSSQFSASESPSHEINLAIVALAASVVTSGTFDIARIPDLSLTYQPRDGDLDDIAALSTTAYGRDFLTLADAAAALAYVGTYSSATIDSLIAAAAAGVGKRGRVRAATTANITIATALNNGDTLDGVSLLTGDLVLVKDQSAPAQNGIYVVGVTPARSADFDTWTEFPGSLISVAEGTASADALFICTSNEGGTLGVTAITFARTVITGELLAANNLSDVQNAATARDNLGVEIGVDVQAWDQDLEDLAIQWGRASGSLQAKLHFHEDTDNGTNRVRLMGPAAITADVDVLLPDAAGTLMLTSAIGTTAEAWDADLDAIAALASTGIAVRTAANTWAQRSVAVSSAGGIAVANGDGIAANPTLSLDADLEAVAALSTTGIVARTAAATYVPRTITGTANQIVVTNGDGVSGAPTLALATAPSFTDFTNANHDHGDADDGGGIVPTAIAGMTTDRLIGRDTAGTGASEQIAVGGGVEFSGSGGIQRSAITGDVTAAAAGGATTVEKIRGNNVTAGTPAIGQAYISDGTNLVLAGTSRRVHTSSGVTIPDNTSANSILSATYDIPANTLAVGDMLEFKCAGSLINTVGSNQGVTMVAKLDSTTLATIGLSSTFANNAVCLTETSLWFVCTAIGASGAISGTFGFWASTTLSFTTAIDGRATFPPVTVDTTQALTLDMTCQKSTVNAALDVVFSSGVVLLNRA